MVEQTPPSSSAVETPAAAPVSLRRATMVAAAAAVLVGILETTSMYLIGRLGPTPRPWTTVAVNAVSWWALWILFMPAVLWLAQNFRFDDSRWRRSAVVHVALGVLISLAHGVVYGIYFHYTNSTDALLPTLADRVRRFLSLYLFTDIMTYAATVGVYYAFEYFAHFRRTALAAAQADARAAKLRLNLAEARLHALRMELNPHFLFNSLNAVAGLVRQREHDAAIGTLDRLGELLRVTFNREMPTEVPLSQELDLLRRFVDIELVRFRDRLRVVWDVAPEVEAALLPPLLLQPLVENALKHGLSRRPGNACLTITARRAGLHLELIVQDSGQGLGVHSGRPLRDGVGLSNIRARLEELYGPDATSLELTDVAGGGARARVLLPYHLEESRRDAAVVA